MELEAKNKLSNLTRALPYLLIVTGIIGALCSFIILSDKLALLENPSYSPPCNINPIISCGSIMQSEQSHVFGFPNPIIGLVFFPIIFTVGGLMLAGGVFKRWAWIFLLTISTLAIIFVHWLMFQSVYNIQALCPYCMIVWVITIALFWYLLQYNLHLRNSMRSGKIEFLITFLLRYNTQILLAWYAIISILILQHFWYYFKTLI